MEAVILIPGIAGSALAQQQGSDLREIWPPDFSDWFWGYPQAKFDILLDKPLQVTGIIDTAIDGAYVAYKPIEEDLKDITDHLNAEYDVFSYDWRQNAFTSMSQLAAQLDAIGSKDSISSITLICHSQGGQIARLMLESGAYSGSTAPWFAKIKRALFICTPHMGAPKALAESLGLESWTASALQTSRLVRKPGILLISCCRRQTLQEIRSSLLMERLRTFISRTLLKCLDWTQRN
jgi:pimeloyl-ACP methyl ester carboxylesterase